MYSGLFRSPIAFLNGNPLNCLDGLSDKIDTGPKQEDPLSFSKRRIELCPL